MNNTLFQEPTASFLEAKRDRASKRKRGKITYLCFNAIYPRAGDRVRCRLGHKMAGAIDGTMALVTVLGGWTGHGCRICGDFNGD